jgi:hypothetical protein
MAKIRTLAFFLVAGVTVFSSQYHAYAVPCDAIVGKWAWFTGGVVTINPDGSFVQQSGKTGTWECTDAERGRFTFRWREGGFVNSLALSEDGKALSSGDPSQHFVTARRINENGDKGWVEIPPSENPIKVGPKGEIDTGDVKVDAQGNVYVDGLGWFCANGDIYSSDGTKLYDGATDKWAEGVLSDPTPTVQPGKGESTPPVNPCPDQRSPK